jgi:predicted nucleic acid-binding protein
MSDRYFLDTNILVYCFEDQRPEKQTRALELVAGALQSGDGIISWQVVQEFLNVALRKFATPLKPQDADEYTRKVLHPLCQVYPDIQLYQAAIQQHVVSRTSFYDALILASAMRGGCKILYSEDFHHGYSVPGGDGLQILNPFLLQK